MNTREALEASIATMLAQSIAVAAGQGIALSLRRCADGWNVHATRTVEQELGSHYRNAVGFAISPNLMLAIDAAVDNCLADRESYTVRCSVSPAGPDILSILGIPKGKSKGA